MCLQVIKGNRDEREEYEVQVLKLPFFYFSKLSNIRLRFSGGFEAFVSWFLSFIETLWF
ncbi:hypothetical protein HanHA89_Chr12g0453411 [Helianthus annuus]|nr:hypothetical protein HanHA89_Chr12g0453411 [Helianthus annuus]